MGKENRRGLFGSSRPFDPIAEGPSKEDIVAFGQPEYDNQSGLALFTQKFGRGAVAALGLSASSVALEACASPRIAQVQTALEQNSSAKLAPIAETPTSTRTPTRTPTVVFTATATETSTPTPSLTPTATEQATATPEKSYSDRFLAAFKGTVSRIQTAMKEKRLEREIKGWENAGPGTLERVSFAKDTLREAQNESDQLTRGMIVDFAFMNLVLVDAGYNPKYAEFQSEEARQELGVQSTLMREMFLALALTPEQTQKMSDLELSGLVVRILAETKEFQKQFSKLPEEWQDKKVESTAAPTAKPTSMPTATAQPVATATPAPAKPTNTPAPRPTRPISTPIPKPEASPTVTKPTPENPYGSWEQEYRTAHISIFNNASSYGVSPRSAEGLNYFESMVVKYGAKGIMVAFYDNEQDWLNSEITKSIPGPLSIIADRPTRDPQYDIGQSKRRILPDGTFTYSIYMFKLSALDTADKIGWVERNILATMIGGYVCREGCRSGGVWAPDIARLMSYDNGQPILALRWGGRGK